MRIDATNHGLGLSSLNSMFEASRAQATSAPGAAADSVSLSARPDAADPMPAGLPGMISANAADALAAHNRLDPERALRLLGLLD